MPSGTGVIGPSGVLTGSTSMGRKHVLSDSYRNKTSIEYFYYSFMDVST